MPRMTRVILPFRPAIASVGGTWKLNRNTPAGVRARAAADLDRGNASAQAIAAPMRGFPAA